MSLDLKSNVHQNNLNGVKPSGSGIYGFEDYRLDAGHLMLYHNGDEVSLTPKQVETLLALIEQRGEIVSKDALMNRLWGDAAVEESNLIQNIYVLRKILGETRDGQPMIETLRRRGYRFNAEVTDHRHRTPTVSAAIRLADLESIPDPLSPSEPTDVPENVPSDKKSKKKVAAAMGGIGLLAALVVASYFAFPAARPVDAGVKTLAILPLRPIDPENRNIFYEIGVAESLIGRLSPLDGILVRSLNSVRKYNEGERDPVVAGREQKVDYVLESSYQLADSRIRIISNLINVATGEVEETYKFEKEASSIFAVQDAIAADFGQRLITRFGASGRGAESRGTDNEEAYGLFQHGMSMLEQQRGGTQKAAEYMDRAVELDPNYAKAWAGKAYASSVIWNSNRSSNHEKNYAVSMDAAKRALAIDPNLSEAYTSLCESKFAYEFNFDEAEKDCKRAIQLDPNSSPAHMTYSMLLNSRGRFDESFAEIRTAMELEPMSLRNQRVFANGLYVARRYDEAIEVYKRLVDLNPDLRMTYLWFLRALEKSGRESEAFEYLIKLLMLDKKDNETIERFRTAYASSGWKGALKERIKVELEEEDPRYLHVAEYYGNLGDKEMALEYLEKAPKRSWLMMYLRVDPRYDPMRGDPRFENLVRRIEGQ